VKYEALLSLIPKLQLSVVQATKELADDMGRMNEIVSRIPKIGETENMERHPLALHYFSSACDWYICEWDGKDRFFGYVILNGDLEMSEWGYISRSELLGVEDVLRKRGDVLNLDLYNILCETIEDALYAKNPGYFYKYKKPENQTGKGEEQ